MCSPRRPTLPLPPPGGSTLLEPYAGALLARQSLQGLGDTEWVVRAATCSTLGLLTGSAWRAVVGALLPMIEDVYGSVRARAAAAAAAAAVQAQAHARAADDDDDDDDDVLRSCLLRTLIRLDEVTRLDCAPDHQVREAALDVLLACEAETLALHAPAIAQRLDHQKAPVRAESEI